MSTATTTAATARQCGSLQLPAALQQLVNSGVTIRIVADPCQNHKLSSWEQHGSTCRATARSSKSTNEPPQNGTTATTTPSSYMTTMTHRKRLAQSRRPVAPSAPSLDSTATATTTDFGSTNCRWQPCQPDRAPALKSRPPQSPIKAVHRRRRRRCVVPVNNNNNNNNISGQQQQHQQQQHPSCNLLLPLEDCVMIPPLASEPSCDDNDRHCPEFKPQQKHTQSLFSSSLSSSSAAAPDQTMDVTQLSRIPLILLASLFKLLLDCWRTATATATATTTTTANKEEGQRPQEHHHQQQSPRTVAVAYPKEEKEDYYDYYRWQASCGVRHHDGTTTTTTTMLSWKGGGWFRTILPLPVNNSISKTRQNHHHHNIDVEDDDTALYLANVQQEDTSNLTV